MVELNVGTVEEIIVPVKDLLGNLTTLDAAAPTFDVYSDDDENDHVITSQSAGNSVLDAICTVDTTGWDARTYRLYLSITTEAGRSILGPGYFKVNSL